MLLRAAFLLSFHAPPPSPRHTAFTSPINYVLAPNETKTYPTPLLGDVPRGKSDGFRLYKFTSLELHVLRVTQILVFSTQSLLHLCPDAPFYRCPFSLKIVLVWMA